MTEQQQVAMIRTILSFMGKQNYLPTAQAVTAILRETQGSSTAGWDLTSNKAPSTPATGGWDIQKNKAAAAPVAAGWNTVSNKRV